MFENTKVDLNCDVGEGCSNDAELLSLVSSANIACGYHAGDRSTMQRTVEFALERGVAIGAHPGYADRENFGRLDVELQPGQLAVIVAEQVAELAAVAAEFGARLTHVKPHGAMYNRSARDPETAAAIARAVRDHDASLILFGLAGSHSINEAEALGLATAAEVFADRAYLPDGALMPRTDPRALIKDAAKAAEQVLDMVKYGRVRTSEGTMIRIRAETVCIHGDGPQALEIANTVRGALDTAKITIRPRNA